LRKLTDFGVIVTGAGRGIGKRLAIRFGQANAKVGLISRNSVELEATRLEIQHGGGEALIAKVDVRTYGKLSTAIHNFQKQFEARDTEIDLLIAAAAIQGPIGPFSTQDPDRWADVLDTNIRGVMNSIRAVLPYMIKQGHGKIIVLSGGGAGSARPNFAPYALSKAALVRLVETVAEEVRDHNIQINCFAPGGAYTSMTDEILAAGELAGQEEIERAEQVRVTGGAPAEKQIQLALFLASEKSNHISGKMIHVTDDLRKLEQANMTADVLTLRRTKL
jgi:NAD(P)-dependent dehydrogenase (short-subunit alcohol dehydrogenase family)